MCNWMHTGSKVRDAKKFHAWLGHPSVAVTKATAEEMGIELMGTVGFCRACTEGKARPERLDHNQAERS